MPAPTSNSPFSAKAGPASASSQANIRADATRSGSATATVTLPAMSDFSTAVVIGASAGIGESMVKKLAAEGTKVAALARRRDRLDALAAATPNVHPYVHDVRDFDTAAPLWDGIVK